MLAPFTESQVQCPDFNQPFHVTTVPSDVAISGILSKQPLRKGLCTVHVFGLVVAAELNYSAAEGSVPISYSVRYLQFYLYVTITIGHDPLFRVYSISDGH